MPLRGVLGVVGDVLNVRIRLRMLALETRHEHSALARGANDERRRSLGRDEGEAGVVQDIGVVEGNRAGEAASPHMFGESLAARVVLCGADPHAAWRFSRQAGS